MPPKRKDPVGQGSQGPSKKQKQDDSTIIQEDGSNNYKPVGKRRWKTVYDAVAGRLISNDDGKDWRNNRGTETEKIIAPDDYLMKLPSAPDDGIPIEYHPDLPSSDLLSAIHSYAAEYFKAHGIWQGYRSMDHSALLGIGILMEEYIDQLLGPNGCEFYAEPEEEQEEASQLSADENDTENYNEV